MGAAEAKLAQAESGEKREDGLVQVEQGEVQEENEEENVEEEEETSVTKKKITVDDIKTAPFDIRFPTTNQTKHCYTRYLEFHKCEKERGEGAPECQKYKRYYRSLCPIEWVERWDEQREEGTFPGPY